VTSENLLQNSAQNGGVTDIDGVGLRHCATLHPAGAPVVGCPSDKKIIILSWR
jgi:hypothetical protein